MPEPIATVETVVAPVTPAAAAPVVEKSLATIMTEASLEAGLDPDTEIAIGDDGEISFVNPKKDKEAADKAAADAAAKAAAGDPVASFEDRYKEVQSAFTKSTQENAVLKESVSQLLQNTIALTNRLSALEKGQTPAAEAETEVDLDTLFQDKTALLGFIQGEIKKGVASGLKAELGDDYAATNDKVRVGLELQSVVNAHSDFKEYGAEMMALVDEFPNESFEKLYQTAKKLRDTVKPSSGESATTEIKPAAVTPEAERVAALKAKAAAIGTESGVGGILPNGTKINSPRDAIVASMAELGL